MAASSDDDHTPHAAEHQNMDNFDTDGRLTREELAWELVEVFEELPTERINELLAKNVPLETLNFLSVYAEDFGAANGIDGLARKRLPNLLVLGYLLRVLEDRLLPDDDDEEDGCA
jgi:hypothetical protein